MLYEFGFWSRICGVHLQFQTQSDATDLSQLKMFLHEVGRMDKYMDGLMTLFIKLWVITAEGTQILARHQENPYTKMISKLLVNSLINSQDNQTDLSKFFFIWSACCVKRYFCTYFISSAQLFQHPCLSFYFIKINIWLNYWSWDKGKTTTKNWHWKFEIVIAFLNIKRQTLTRNCEKLKKQH